MIEHHFVRSASMEHKACIFGAPGPPSAISSSKKDKARTTHDLWRIPFPDSLRCGYSSFKKRKSRSADIMPHATKDFLLVDGSWTIPWFEADFLSMNYRDIHTGMKVSCLQDQRDLGARSAHDISESCDDRPLTEAIQDVDCMIKKGTFVPVPLFFRLLQRCISERDLTAGRELHQLIVRAGLDSDLFLGSHLIHMLSVFESSLDVNQVFRKLSKSTGFFWKEVILAQAKLGQNEKAIDLYHQMRQAGVEADSHTFVAVLKACSRISALEQGKLIHAYSVEMGFECDMYVGSTLIDMYSRRGSLYDARAVFDSLPERSVVTWNTMIAGYSQHGYRQQAFHLFQQMQEEGIAPSEVTFICMLKACSITGDLEQGKQLHTCIIERGYECSNVGNTLIDLYGKCGALGDARRVFDKLHDPDIVTWNAMMTSYTQHGQVQEALQLFLHMQKDGMQPNQVTSICVLAACSAMKSLGTGKQIHAQLIESRIEVDLNVDNALIDMYSKCGNLEDALVVFEKMKKKDVVTWNAMITGFAQHGCIQEALELLSKMQQAGIKPNSVTFVCILKACSTVAALEQGKHIHFLAAEYGFESDLLVSNSLIDMYSKCGSLSDARTVFDKLSKLEVATWNLMIGGYAEHGHGQEALQLFQQMQQVGTAPDKVTYISIMKACSSIAALGCGRQIHHAMREDLKSDMIVANALVDMYAKCGSLEDAHLAFDELQNRDIVTWTAMISGYGEHNDYVSASKYFDDMQHAGMKPDDVAFVCLLSACSRAGLVDEGCFRFKSMRAEYGIAPTSEHYTCMVDLLGGRGLLREAVDLLETMPFGQNIIGWKSLLSSCRAHNNVEIARHCFNNVVTIEKRHGAAYALMSSIYANAGQWEEVHKIEEQRRCVRAWKKPGRAFIEIENYVHCFTAEDQTHPRRVDIYTKLAALSWEIRKQGSLDDSCSNLDFCSTNSKENPFCGHCEKLAIAFGLISTPQGTTIRLAKDLRMCAECHLATRLISKLESREIIVKDTCCIHHFKDGTCSCKDHF